MNLGLLCGAVLVLLTGPAAAQVTTFDVFGVRVGDGPEAVTRALTEKGFSKDVELRGPTFDEQVALRRNKIDLGSANGAVKEITYRRDFDKISIMFTAWPDGEKVTRVFYRPNITQADCPAFKTAAQQKYAAGIEYAGEWIDRPLEKMNGFSESKLDETVSIAAKCSAGSRYLAMDLSALKKCRTKCSAKPMAKSNTTSSSFAHGAAGCRPTLPFLLAFSNLVSGMVAAKSARRKCAIIGCSHFSWKGGRYDLSTIHIAAWLLHSRCRRGPPPAVGGHQSNKRGLVGRAA